MLGHSERDFPVPSELREAIKNHLDIPVVFKNQIKSWSTPLLNSNLTGKYGNTVLDFRIVPKSYKGVSWEAQHTFEEATISDFISWQNEENVALDSTNPFKKYKKNEYWAYSSYNYMNVIFPNDSDIQTMKWDAFGFPEVTGKESTFWLGSEGANTPCHFDSYGCNLVAQITGRIPYEESSVFSSVNILNVDFTCHPLFKNAHPHIITLEPGDVLFVPKKWWHFVSCLDNITISINTWIELDSDPHCRLEEGVARALMSALITFYEPDKENWLNPKEELVSPNEAIKYITTSLQEIGGITDKDQDKNPQFSKVCKTAGKFDVHNSKPKLLSNYHLNLNSFSAALLYQKEIKDKPVGRYKCSFCYYSTDRTTSFKNHQLVHSGERPFKCPICSFGFTTKQNLRRHLPLHK
ncbi:HSPB1-associated protein 1 like protein [Argiope bruennichi]|uniref:HSPB1-associated protein 1 like protein n=1 Tax=Argiope bruennichi TaxID=94029 RepID=A0A8T0FX73_ARGBR|nr:HSPB1-associated protein 1 like protein [Argiope bruennichi]